MPGVFGREHAQRKLLPDEVVGVQHDGGSEFVVAWLARYRFFDYRCLIHDVSSALFAHRRIIGIRGELLFAPDVQNQYWKSHAGAQTKYYSTTLGSL